MSETAIIAPEQSRPAKGIFVRAVMLLYDYITFHLLLVLWLVVYMVVLPVLAADKLLGTNIQSPLIALFVRLAR